MKLVKFFLTLILSLTLTFSLPGFSFAEATPLISVKVDTPPALDGDGGDDVWKKAKEVGVEAEDGPEINIKSVYTKDEIFFLVSWTDETESVSMDQWVYDGEKWNIKQEKRVDETGNADTDRLGFQWPIKDASLIKSKIKGEEFTFIEKGCTVICHSPEKEDKMYTSASGQVTDIWQWKAALTNPLKYADGMYQDHTNILKTQEPDKFKRVTAAQKGDDMGPGELNFQPNKAGNGPKWMSKGGPNKPFLIKGEEVPLDMSKIKKGDAIPGWLLARPKGSRGNINAVGKYHKDDIIWVVELGRKLVTDDKAHDTQFDDLKKTYYFGLSTWDNDRLQTHTRVKNPFALTFK
jgi:hypothetical protein